MSCNENPSQPWPDFDSELHGESPPQVYSISTSGDRLTERNVILNPQTSTNQRNAFVESECFVGCDKRSAGTPFCCHFCVPARCWSHPTASRILK